MGVSSPVLPLKFWCGLYIECATLLGLKFIHKFRFGFVDVDVTRRGNTRRVPFECDTLANLRLSGVRRNRKPRSTSQDVGHYQPPAARTCAHTCSNHLRVCRWTWNPHKHRSNPVVITTLNSWRYRLLREHLTSQRRAVNIGSSFTMVNRGSWARLSVSVDIFSLSMLGWPVLNGDRSLTPVIYFDILIHLIKGTMYTLYSCMQWFYFQIHFVPLINSNFMHSRLIYLSEKYL